jgi:hypothetical protein
MTDDKMPPLPAYVYGRETAANERMIPLGDAEAWRNAARAYAAEQVRELVGELERINDWCCYATEEDISARLLALQQIGQAVRALIAKHKGTP